MLERSSAQIQIIKFVYIQLKRSQGVYEWKFKSINGIVDSHANIKCSTSMSILEEKFCPCYGSY